MSDEVSEFLEQVERLRGQQIEEDETRARELEEYLAAKRERQARRQERARSISPQKSSPANTPSPSSFPDRRSVHPSDSIRLESPASHGNASRETSIDSEAEADTTRNSIMSSSTSDGPSKENEAPLDIGTKRSGATTTPPARNSTLSWQQRRPNSRGGPGGRPLSMVAAQNATQRSLAGSQDAPAVDAAKEETLSKDQIAQSLGSKDPSWFRQTADRGKNNAAYRKNQVEDLERADVSSASAQLPGMSRQISSHQAAPHSNSPATTTPQGLASPLPLHPPKPAEASRQVDNASPDQAGSGRTSPARSASPTKGMGGFVQSAMMKRSDSVKRWSVTSPPGLTRADSVAANRTSTQPRGESRPSRPQSMYRTSASPSIHERKDSDSGHASTADSSHNSADKTTASQQTHDGSLPTSPTKTMDQRRWSPTKSSWLESALNKPESPKPAPKPYNATQPAWMVELNKSKAERAAHPDTDARPPAPSHKHQVSIGGLKRPEPMGAAKMNAPGLGGIYSPPVGGSRTSPTHTPKQSISKSLVSSPGEGPLDFTDQSQDKISAEGEMASRLKATEQQASITSSKDTKPELKPKPEAPNKGDLRSSLKPRVADTGHSKGEEPEFRNALGNLRRAKTQNYVAPDELKGNILKGKAALNVTGGPQKTERKDEFKEAILKKRGDFKKAQDEGKGITRTAPTTANRPLPEGLAKRSQLGRQKTGSDPVEAAVSTTPTKNASPKPAPGPKMVSSGSHASPKPSPPTKPSIRSPSSGQIRKVSTEPVDARSPSSSRPSPALKKEPSAPTRLAGRGEGGKLANRFNPALAGMLARGPPPMATNGDNGADNATLSPRASKPSAQTVEPTVPGPQLTHMTKGRARGPKRKAPTSATTAPVKPEETSSPSAEQLAKPTAPSLPSKPIVSQETKNQEKLELKTNPTGFEGKSEPNPSVETSRSGFSIQQQVAAKAATRGKPEASTNGRQQANEPSPLKPIKTGDAQMEPGSPKKLGMNRMSKFLDQGDPGSKPETAKEPIKLTHQRTGSRSPTKLDPSEPDPLSASPPKVDREPVAAVKSSMAVFGGSSMRLPPLTKPNIQDLPSSVPPAPETPKTPSRAVPPPVDSPVRSPSKAASETGKILQDFFGAPKAYKMAQIDPAEILMARTHSAGRITPKSVRMFQFSSDGKKVPVAQQYERVLFEREMYLCSHEFINEAGWKKSEVYLWVGDEIPEAAADDAMLFAAKEAKFLGGKLIKMLQGKETSEFLQALGGVIIVRRGSSNKYDSLAPNMLCGRRYLNEVVFDEVDFSPSSLCAGFPYLVTDGGKSYLWRGKGSSAEETSAAKLTGMDMTLTGELIECDDGKEPDAFWALFEGGSKPHSADHWRLKPSYGKYCGRLFASDSNSRQQIYEISPFSQADLSPSSIYVLDAFFEIYVIVGRGSQSQYTSFRNALNFAQEYAILASSVEDRPFIPISSVVLEGIPRDMKSVFRKWRDDKSPTVTNPPGGGTGLRRGRSLRVVTLTQALQALKE